MGLYGLLKLLAYLLSPPDRPSRVYLLAALRPLAWKHMAGSANSVPATGIFVLVLIHLCDENAKYTEVEDLVLGRMPRAYSIIPAMPVMI